MPDFIRVKDKQTKHEFTIPASRFNPEAHTKLANKEALGRDGAPAPVKYHTELGTPLPGSKQARKRAQQATPDATAASGEIDGQSAASEEEN